MIEDVERAKRPQRVERHMDIPSHPCNGDESRYAAARFFASYTKGLLRAGGLDGELFGEVDAATYCTLLRAIRSGNENDFEAVTLGFNNNCAAADVDDDGSRIAPPDDNCDPLQRPQQRRLESPQAGYNFDLEGKDYYQLINRSNQFGTTDPVPVAFPEAFRFDSPEKAVEIIENYWQMLTRDVPFINYNSDGTVFVASRDLSRFIPFYRSPKLAGEVLPQVYSRGTQQAGVEHLHRA